MTHPNLQGLEGFQRILSGFDEIDEGLGAQAALQERIDIAARKVNEARAEFLAANGLLFERGIIVEQFLADRPAYYRFLARVGSEQSADTDPKTGMLAQTAQTIGKLHEADTLAAIYSRNREHPDGGPRWMVGRIAAGTTVSVDTHDKGTTEDPHLMVNATIASATGNDEVSLAVGDIAWQYNPNVFNGGSGLRTALGVAALQHHVVVHFPYNHPTNGEVGHEPQTHNTKEFMSALGLSGVKLNELGYPDDYIATARVATLARYEQVLTGRQLYAHDVPRFSVLSSSNHAAYRN